MDQKTSNLFGEISYNPNEYFKTKYNFSKKNNLKILPTKVSVLNLILINLKHLLIT